MIANLLTNAAKYSDSGKTVSLKGERNGAEIRIIVSDQGIGLEPELQERIFGLFVQNDQAADRALGGLGLGLAIVRSLVDLHGGKVSVHSEGRNKGSTFVVTLPEAVAADTVAPARMTRARPAQVIEPRLARCHKPDSPSMSRSSDELVRSGT